MITAKNRRLRAPFQGVLMFGIGMPEMLLILAVALIVIGPKKLPELAKSLGKALGEFKKATHDLKESFEVESELNEVKKSLTELESDIDTRPVEEVKSEPSMTPLQEPGATDAKAREGATPEEPLKDE
jgi:sec-independent protein translocase protein TatB